MRCKSCDYSLWNMRERVCPECGSPFKPSDFDFPVSAVKFCCPHCAQAYYGTGAHGHLEPASFACVGCSRLVTMDEMIVLPGDHVPPSASEVATNVWEQPGERSLVDRWWRTLKDTMLRPGRLIDATAPAGARLEEGDPRPRVSVVPALRFAILTNSLGALVALAPLLVMFLVSMLAGGAAMLGPIAGGLLTGLVVGLVVFPIVLLAWALSAHGMLVVTGGAPLGLGRTVQCFAYGSGPNVVVGLPCLGGYFSWIWWVIASILMLRSGQRISGGRAAAAVLVPAAVAVLTCVGGYVGFVAWAINTGGRMASVTVNGQTVPPAANSPTQPGAPATPSLAGAINRAANLASAFEGYVDEFGDFPQHALRLLGEGRISVSDLIASGSRFGQVPGTGVALADLAGRSREGRMEVVRRVEQGMPEGVIAYRVGGWVFTHTGMSAAKQKTEPWRAGLWIAVMPAEVGAGEPWVVVVPARGRPLALGAERLEEEWVAQNALRAWAGLAPLPSLEELEAITPEKPWMVEGQVGVGGPSGE